MRPRHAFIALLLAAPLAHAQYVSGGNQYNSAGGAMLAQRIQMVLNYHPTPQDNATATRARTQPQANAITAPPRPSAGNIAALRFTPASDGDALKKFADDLGKNADERQQLLQAITATKVSFEQQYGSRGWKNNVAGAFAFFIGSIGYVWSGNEPDVAAQNRLFDALAVILADSPDMAGASNRDKAALYDTLIASTSLPLLLYVDGVQQGNKAEMQQARTLAAEYSRKIMHVEPQALAGMLQAANGGNAVASSATPAARPVASAGAHALDGRYDCQMLSVRAGASFSVEYRPIGLWFVIDGDGYTSAKGGGRIDGGADVVGFRGGAYDGWRGARVNDAIVFRKEDHSQPLPGQTVRNGDIRCGRHG